MENLALIDQRINFEKQILNIEIDILADHLFTDIDDQLQLFETKFRCAKRLPIPHNFYTADDLMDGITLIQGVATIEFLGEVDEEFTFIVRHKIYKSEVLYREFIHDITEALKWRMPVRMNISLLTRITENDNTLYIKIGWKRVIPKNTVVVKFHV